MSCHRATCSDCSWSEESDDLLELSDAVERHSRKEVGHDIDLEQAVATDGGTRQRSHSGGRPMNESRSPIPLDVIEEHEEVFQTIAVEAENEEIAERFGDQPLKLLELGRKERDQA